MSGAMPCIYGKKVLEDCPIRQRFSFGDIGETARLLSRFCANCPHKDLWLLRQDISVRKVRK